MSHWTTEELAIVRRAPHWHVATAGLPHRTTAAVQRQWFRTHTEAHTRQRAKVVYGPGARPPLDTRETKVAQILSAVKRIADRERIAVKAGDLIDALRDSDWERMQSIEWQAQLVVGRDVQ